MAKLSDVRFWPQRDTWVTGAFARIDGRFYSFSCTEFVYGTTFDNVVESPQWERWPYAMETDDWRWRHDADRMAEAFCIAAYRTKFEASLFQLMALIRADQKETSNG